MKKNFYPWLSAALLLLLIGFLWKKNNTKTPPPETTLFDYNFDLQSIDGGTISAKELDGKVLFINLWATWCGPCRAEMKSIQTLYTSVRDRNEIVFIMLSLDDTREIEKVTQYVESKEFTFPVYFPSGKLPELLSVPSIPTTFIINKKGEISRTEIGQTDFTNATYKELLTGLAAD